MKLVVLLTETLKESKKHCWFKTPALLLFPGNSLLNISYHSRAREQTIEYHTLFKDRSLKTRRSFLMNSSTKQFLNQHAIITEPDWQPSSCGEDSGLNDGLASRLTLNIHLHRKTFGPEIFKCSTGALLLWESWPPCDRNQSIKPWTGWWSIACLIHRAPSTGGGWPRKSDTSCLYSTALVSPVQLHQSCSSGGINAATRQCDRRSYQCLSERRGLSHKQTRFVESIQRAASASSSYQRQIDSCCGALA